MEELRRAGIDPFGKRFSRTHLAREILDEFAGVEDFDAVEKREVRIAGRIVSCGPTVRLPLPICWI